MFGNDRERLRRYYVAVWEKAEAGQPLEPLEQIIADVIREHPEYQSLLRDAETAVRRDFTPEMEQANPFLHMGMHIAIQEQLGGDRPKGFREVYRRIRRRVGDAHAAEHAMMECLGQTLWEAQRDGVAPDERAYLARLRRLAT